MQDKNDFVVFGFSDGGFDRASMASIKSGTENYPGMILCVMFGTFIYQLWASNAH